MGTEISKIQKFNIDNPGVNNIYNACKDGKLETVKLLLEEEPEFRYLIYDHTFSSSCENGHLEVAKFLLKVNPSIDISEDDEYPFRFACENGHLEVAKWLYSVKPTIDISIDNEYAFKYACKNGHLEVVKWLIKIKPLINITSENHYAFRYACQKGHLEVAKFLSSINKNYKIDISKDTIQYYILKNIPIDFTKKIDINTIDKDSRECPICYENVVNIQTQCKHNYCKDCIQIYYNKNNNCPCCRTNLDLFYPIE